VTRCTVPGLQRIDAEPAPSCARFALRLPDGVTALHT
jgi:hypothetical protein